MASHKTNTKRPRLDKERIDRMEQPAESEHHRTVEGDQSPLDTKENSVEKKWSETISASFLVLHFILAYPMTGYKLYQTIVYVTVLATHEFFFKGFSYLLPIGLGYMNIHLGALFISAKFIEGPLEERQCLAAIYGRITYLLLRAKEFEWIKGYKSSHGAAAEVELPYNTNNVASIIQWCIVVVFLAMPRGIILFMFGIILALFINPIMCKGEECQETEDQDSFWLMAERMSSTFVQYFSVVTQVQCITALIAYCTGMAFLLYLARYTRVSGKTLQDLALLLFGGFGLLLNDRFVGIVMVVVALCLTNSEFYKGVILGEDRDLLSSSESSLPSSPDNREDSKADRRQEIRNKIVRAKHAASRNHGDIQEIDGIVFEFFPYLVPEATPKESLVPTGSGGTSWNGLMAMVIALYFPYYDYSLSKKLQLIALPFEYATAMTSVVHPVVR